MRYLLSHHVPYERSHKSEVTGPVRLRSMAFLCFLLFVSSSFVFYFEMFIAMFGSGRMSIDASNFLIKYTVFSLFIYVWLFSSTLYEMTLRTFICPPFLVRFVSKHINHWISTKSNQECFSLFISNTNFSFKFLTFMSVHFMHSLINFHPKSTEQYR